MEKRLSIALVLALTGCLALADSTPSTANGTVTKDTVGKGYGSPYGQNDNSYGHGYGKPNNYGPRPQYSPPQPYGNAPSYPPHGGPPPYAGASDYSNSYGPQTHNSYGSHYNHAPSYDAYGSGSNAYNNYQQSQQYPASYPDSGPFYFHNKHHYYDTHYCSVHGSFSLAYSTEERSEKNSYNSKPEPKGYGLPEPTGYGSSGYGDNNGYSNGYANNQIKRKTRFYTRQYCRYSAASSAKACNFCCRVVARSSNTSPDDIVSAIFAFDPVNPTKNGAGFDVDEYSPEEKGYDKSSDNKSSSIYQCVCCAPKHSYK